MGMGSRSRVINFSLLLLLFLFSKNTQPSFSSSPSTKNRTHLCLPDQRDALLRFKNAYNITDWDEHVDCCLWEGITCHHITGDVIEVSSYSPLLMGTINHITYLLPLHNLQVLQLDSNHLYGVVPPELSRFSKLNTLNLCCNDELTMESHSLKLLVQNLTQLEFLDLYGVKIFGDPFNALVNISNALTDLNLYNCDLHGVFPESIFHLPNLQYLSLSGNLTVSFPTSNWSSQLISLELSSANFFGKLPNSIGNLKNLSALSLSSPHLSNLLPPSLENLTQLTYLSLSSFAQRDAFPSLICRLGSLQWLSLPGNKFCGAFPQCLGNLTELVSLDLSFNQLTQLSLPSPANFTKLHGLLVNSNKISDTLTHWLKFFPNLQSIDLGANKFQGEIPISICEKSPSLVALSNNKLTGTIPPCLINNSFSQVLNLRMNKLDGTIPDTFPQDCSIEELDLSENQLKGPLPRSMINCSALTILSFANNNIEDVFPNFLETLPKLKVLVLKFNKLHGDVKTFLNHHPFPKLSIFDISNNNFTGLLPVEYIAQFDAMKNITNVFYGGSMYLEVMMPYYNEDPYSMTTPMTIKGSTLSLPKVLKSLKLIDFSNNNFHGEIPKFMGNLIALKGLNLSHNNLIGNIPPSIQFMTNLEWLDFSSNKLTGEIPVGLAQLTGLEIFNLSHNELRGMIPKGKQFDTFGKDSFVGNRELCGSQIAVVCGMPHASNQLPLPYIHEDDFSVFDWKIISMGYGCGLVIGLSIGYIVFEFQRPKWFKSLVEENLLKMTMRPRSRANRLRRT